MNVSRRQALRTTAVTVGAAALPWSFSNRAYGANERIRMAVIGLNGRGRSHIGGFASQIVAMCDCDEAVLNARVESFAGQQNGRTIDAETDFRRILDRNDIDAVSIATPNHTHSLIGILAAQSGKDVYVEKPVSHNVWEGRQLAHAARRYNRIIQCGTQGRSSIAIQQAVKYVHEGKLGKIQHVIGTCYKGRGSIGQLDKPLQIPQSVDYDLWCGPAAKVPLYRPKLHYDWHWDFNTGNGDMGNQGIHQMDIARWFLGVDTLSPVVLSVGGRLGYEDAGNTPNSQVALHAYETPLIFETRGLPKSKAAQKTWGKSMDNYRGSSVGVVVQCEQGYVVATSNYNQVNVFDNDGNVVETFTGNSNHFANFLDAVRSRKREDLNAEVLEGHLSSALCHTGNISHQLGDQKTANEIRGEMSGHPAFADSFERLAVHLDANEVDVDAAALTFGARLTMDPETERFTNHDEANRLLTREYRQPFVVPKIA
ncbi:MAG: Gfo/Idh/MocA family oxidoreductase [Pirellulaceae bacterium]|nr:Gfo/Idh/MocA family oxidoreductase [Pirellulaceae bacterium]